MTRPSPFSGCRPAMTHALHPPRLLTLMLALAYGSLAHGQEPAASSNRDSLAMGTLKTVVISGSREEQLQDEQPFAMDVLSARDLQDRQLLDIRDVAKDLPNVSVKHAPARFRITGPGNITGRDGNAGFTIRGLGGNRVLMLVDGVRLPRSYINGNNAFGRDTLSLDLLKRIELVRGPSSVLYGSDGLAGLVNYITHEPADFLNPTGQAQKTWGGRVAAGWSSEDQGLSLSTTLAHRASDAVDWMLTGTVRRDEGQDNMGRNNAANEDRTTPNPQTHRSGSLLGKLVIRPTGGQKHVLTLEHAQKASDYELLSSRSKPPLVAASVAGETSEQTLKRDRLTWSGRYTLGAAWADQLQTVLSWQNTRAQDDGRTVRQDNKVRIRDTSYAEQAWQAGVQASKTLPLSAQWVQKITYGVDYTRTDVTSWFDGFDPAPLAPYVPKRYFPNTRETSTAAYAQSEFGSDRWLITPGVRLEQFDLKVLTQDGYAPPSPTLGKSLSGSNVSPKLGILYRATPQWSVFGNYASGFRAPNATQVNGFSENPTPTSFVQVLSNPELKPETSQNLELGLRGSVQNLSLEVVAFTGKFNQLIVDKKPLGGSGVSGDPLIFQSVNVDNATIQGFEVKGSVDWGMLAGGRLTTPFSYGQTRGTDDATGLPLNAVDPSKLVLGLRYQTGQWDWRLDAMHNSAKRADDLDSPYLPKPVAPPRKFQFTVPASTTLDLSAQWRPRKDLRVNFAVTNLTDTKHWLWSDVQGLDANAKVVDAYTQPGRHIKLSVVKDF